jgi:diguanylate cyclase (GGDEF)-like protein
MQNHGIQGDLAVGVLDSLHEENVLTLDLVSAFAGDRPLTEFETLHLDDVKKSRGDEFFTDLLYSISHECFPPTVAEGLWNEILRHKFELSGLLHRNVGIAVAALDFLSNLKGELKAPTLIGESHVADIARLALRDGLTRLFNHATCLEKIAVEMRIYQRYGRAASLMMVDVDDFKKINDQYGHQAGDRVLAALGETIDTATRGSDICCRYGGEEFAVILPATGAQEAGLLAERLRVRAEQCLPDGRHVTVSIGVASCGADTSTAEALVEKADAALYQAKKNGKNRVVVSAGQPIGCPRPSLAARRRVS